MPRIRRPTMSLIGTGGSKGKTIRMHRIRRSSISWIRTSGSGKVKYILNIF